MLRVITKQHGDRYTVELHGRIAGEWVPFLDQYWRHVADSVPRAKITAVISDVVFIDGDGERLLQRMADGGVEFVVSGCMNRYVIEKIQPRAIAAGGRDR